MPSVVPDLVFDLGMHVGEDTNFYLARGFRVVSLEANPILYEAGCKRFAKEMLDGRLVIVNAAFCDDTVPGDIEFFISTENDEWSSLEKFRVDQGAPTRSVRVPRISLTTLVGRFGLPYYIKSDMEGADADFVRQLLDLRASGVPKFVSVEGIAFEWLAQLAATGYDRFQFINQAKFRRGMSTPLTFEVGGAKVEWKFAGPTSGPFGFDLPMNKWLTLTQMAERWLQFVHLKQIDPEITLDNWFDIHATTLATLNQGR